MKPSSGRSATVTLKLRPQAAARLRQVATLYLAAAAGLLLLAATVSSPATASPSKEVVASGQSSLAPAVGEGREDQLALASSTATAQLVPVRHSESVSSVEARTSTRSSDLSMGQSNIANAKVHVGPKDMTAAAGHHYGGKSHGKYYMYAEVPKKGAYKMGFKRGNHKHMIERKESVHKGHVHGHFKWHDKKGKGSHKYEYKHYDKKGKHHHY